MTTTSHQTLLAERLHAVINSARVKHCAKYPNIRWICEVRPGKKYLKVVMGHVTGLAEDAPIQWSVWCFVDATTGDVYKPASWRGPAKHVRYNLLDDASFKLAVTKADACGGWLYMN